MGLISAAGLTAAFSVFFAGIFAHYLPLLAFYLFLITVACTYYALQYSTFFYPLLIINSLTILAGCLVPTFQENIARSVTIIGVSVLLLLIQMLLSPGLITRTISRQTKKSFHLLNLVKNDLFSCFLQPAYIDNVYLFEKRLHERKKYFLRSLNRLRVIQKLTNRETQAEKLDMLFDILMDIGQLRRRVSDHTIFSICSDELSSISIEMSKALKGEDNLLAEKIQLLEDSFHHVLKVTAREPLAFILAIASLKAFREYLL